MTKLEDIIDHIPYHNEIESFNYDLVVDWAINLIKNNQESENIFMLTSFTKPVDSQEIKPFLSLVLEDLDIEEKKGKEATLNLIKYYLLKVIELPSEDTLNPLYKLFLERDGFGSDPFELSYFYFLYHSYGEIKEFNNCYYIEDVSPASIDLVSREKARHWLANFRNIL